MTSLYVYIWYMPDTLVARAQWYVMWEELSVNHFLKHSNHVKRTLILFSKFNRGLWLLFNIQSSDYGATTLANVSRYSTFTWSTVSFAAIVEFRISDTRLSFIAARM